MMASVKVISTHTARYATKGEGYKAKYHHEENLGFLRDDVIQALP
jgi:hypothetical protein